MSNTTVDLDKPSFYSEPNSFLYRLKRKLTYKTILKILSKYINNSKDYRVLEIGTGSGFLASFLESKYKNINFVGLEYDPRLVELGNNKLKKNTISREKQKISISKKILI